MDEQPVIRRELEFFTDKILKNNQLNWNNKLVNGEPTHLNPALAADVINTILKDLSSAFMLQESTHNNKLHELQVQISRMENSYSKKLQNLEYIEKHDTFTKLKEQIYNLQKEIEYLKDTKALLYDGIISKNNLQNELNVKNLEIEELRSKENSTIRGLNEIVHKLSVDNERLKKQILDIKSKQVNGKNDPTN
jgi:hypothetical protein